VFPAGNGKRNDDNCACDSYVNSIYTIVVASCDEHGHATFYSERCAAILTTAFGGSGFDKNVVCMHVYIQIRVFVKKKSKLNWIKEKTRTRTRIFFVVESFDIIRRQLILR